MIEELGFEHSQGVEGFSSRAFSVVEPSELASDVFGVDGVEHLFYFHCFFNL